MYIIAQNVTFVNIPTTQKKRAYTEMYAMFLKIFFRKLGFLERNADNLKEFFSFFL